MMMKKMCSIFLSVGLLFTLTACPAETVQNISTPDSFSFVNSSLSSETSLVNEKSQDPSSLVGSSSTALSQFSPTPSSSRPTSASPSTSVVSPSVTLAPTPTTIPALSAGKAIVFDDPLCEKLLRDFAKKPSGTCYDSDFHDLSIDSTSSVYIEYRISDNKTTLFDSHSEAHSEVTGMPSSFAVLSQIPVRHLTLYSFVAPGRTDVAQTFNMSNVTASHELRSFVFKGLDTISLRTSLEQYMTLTNFNSISSCAKLKALVLWDCKSVSLSSVASLQDLQVLSLVNCSVTSIAALSNAKKLWKLELCYNNVTDFTPLANNPSLSEVMLSDITGSIDVDTFITCPSMKHLILRSCIPLTAVQRGQLTSKGITFTEY